MIFLKFIPIALNKRKSEKEKSDFLYFKQGRNFRKIIKINKETKKQRNKETNLLLDDILKEN